MNNFQNFRDKLSRMTKFINFADINFREKVKKKRETAKVSTFTRFFYISIAAKASPDKAEIW